MTLEAKIVHLADKFTQDENMVSIAESYRKVEEKHGMIPKAMENIRQRRDYLNVTFRNFVAVPDLSIRTKLQ